MTEQIAARRDMANAIRALAMDAVQQADSGHPGMPMGMADVATVLFTKFLKFDASEPHWRDRDRFILSAGHGSMLLYSLLHLTGYADMTLDELKHFRQLGSRTAGHPEHGHASGIETTTGPLGQGLATSFGMALASRWAAATFNRPGFEMFNFDVYRIARMADYPPQVNIRFLKTDNKWTMGVGDEAISQIAPAMAQAIFKITGKRIRSLPFGKHDLSWA